MSETIMVTGAAGFIGSYTAKVLLDRGYRVVGIDEVNDYYPVALKQARLAQLEEHPAFTFHKMSVADHDGLNALPERDAISRVIHLAAQAGVRHGLKKPFDYAASNLVGHLSILEFCRHAPKKPFLVYASSSSVYGDSSTAPFSEAERADEPASLYAATKRADELMSSSYAHLYDMPQIGLRFFTVYGPWGRPDMAYWSFTDRIMRGEPIRVFNNGKLRRDFTYIDDIVRGVVATALEKPHFPSARPHRVYNIGNNRPVELMRFIEVIEDAVGKKAEKIMEGMQPGDVHETCANVDALAADYGFAPSTPLEDGIPRFVEWYRAYVGEGAAINA